MVGPDFPNTRDLQVLWRTAMSTSRFPANKAQWKQRQRRAAGRMDHLLLIHGHPEKARVSLIADTVAAVEGWRPADSTVREWLKQEDARFQKTVQNRKSFQA